MSGEKTPESLIGTAYPAGGCWATVVEGLACLGVAWPVDPAAALASREKLARRLGPSERPRRGDVVEMSGGGGDGGVGVRASDAGSHVGLMLDEVWVLNASQGSGVRRDRLAALRRAGVVVAVLRPAEMEERP